MGWGGAFTDAAGINTATLSIPTQDKLIRSYYHSSGLDYNIGGCDFSPRAYTYCDTPGDVTLGTFALQEEDLVYKIPYILQAQALKEEPLMLFASPWTAPPWMKSNNDYIGHGYLLPEYYQVWANYFIKFLDDYKALGVDFWGMTAQNEPGDGNLEDFSFNCMGWNASTQATFVADNLGPTLESAGYEDIKLMTLDGQRPRAPMWAREVFANPEANRHFDGIAIHWYEDDMADDAIDTTAALDTCHEEFPDKFILYSEACNGYVLEPVALGSWHRGEKYLHNIIEDVNHWVQGWTDWNLALDMEGGPNWAGNMVDAPIITNGDADEFYKQPMYYALGHVSRYLVPGSQRVSVMEETESKLSFVGVERPDGGVAVVIMNKDNQDVVKITIYDEEQGYLDLDLGPSSYHTIVYWN